MSRTCCGIIIIIIIIHNYFTCHEVRRYRDMKCGCGHTSSNCIQSLLQHSLVIGVSLELVNSCSSPFSTPQDYFQAYVLQRLPKQFQTSKLTVGYAHDAVYMIDR